MAIDFKGLVDREAGLLNRRVFSDPKIYELERENVFARCWLYLGHESELPNPGDRTRHLITNVRVKDAQGSELEVHSNFLTYRTRLERDKDTFVGKREDMLRRVDGHLKLARRTIILDEATLGAKNISIFL